MYERGLFIGTLSAPTFRARGTREAAQPRYLPMCIDYLLPSPINIRCNTKKPLFNLTRWFRAPRIYPRSSMPIRSILSRLASAERVINKSVIYKRHLGDTRRGPAYCPAPSSPMAIAAVSAYSLRLSLFLYFSLAFSNVREIAPRKCTSPIEWLLIASGNKSEKGEGPPWGQLSRFSRSRRRARRFPTARRGGARPRLASRIRVRLIVCTRGSYVMSDHPILVPGLVRHSPDETVYVVCPLRRDRRKSDTDTEIISHGVK